MKLQHKCARKEKNNTLRSSMSWVISDFHAHIKGYTLQRSHSGKMKSVRAFLLTVWLGVGGSIWSQVSGWLLNFAIFVLCDEGRLSCDDWFFSETWVKCLWCRHEVWCTLSVRRKVGEIERLESAKWLEWLNLTSDTVQNFLKDHVDNQVSQQRCLTQNLMFN